MAVPPHLYSYPLYVYRMLVQLFLADLRVLEDGTGVRDDLRALHDYYTDVRRTAADYPEEWLRTLPARVRGQVVECFARVADAHLVNVVTQYGHDDDFALGVARRTAWQAVRDQRGARRPLAYDAANAHLDRLAPRHATLAAACAARDDAALHDAVGDAAHALALDGAPTAAQWQWLSTLAALLAPDAIRMAPDDVAPAALCMRAAHDVERGMRLAYNAAVARIKAGAASAGGPPVVL